jgi:predicted permease
MLQDLKFALRQLLRSPGFTAVAVITLALGIGATTTLVSVVDTLMFKPPVGVVEPDRVVRPYFRWDLWTGSTVSYPDFTDLRDQVKAFSHVAAVYRSQTSLGSGANAKPVKLYGVTGQFFELLGTPPAMGRVLSSEDDRPGAPAYVTVITDAYWRRELGGAADALGRMLELGNHRYEIVGIMPHGFSGSDLEGPDLWVPFSAVGPSFGGSEFATQRGSFFLFTLARLAPGATTAEAEAQATAAITTGRANVRNMAKFESVQLGPIQEARGPGAKDTAHLAVWLMGVSLMVLLLACANVANLLLARGLERGREIAIRKALGAGRGRVLRQLLTEGLLLGLMGGVAALLVAVWGGAVVRRLLLPSGAAQSFTLDGRVFLAALIASVGAGALAGLLPAWRAARGNLNTMIKDGAPAAAGGRSRLRGALVVVQVTISLLLVAGTGLFVQSLRHALALDLGFDVDRVVYVGAELSAIGFPPAELQRAFEAMREAVQHQPGVESTSLSHGGAFDWSFAESVGIPGRDSLASPPGGGPYFQSVTPEYLSTVGLTILAGRGLTVEDRQGSAPVMVISQGMARFFWPGQNPVGTCMRVGDDKGCTRIVGIAEDGRRSGILEETGAMFYIPLAQASEPPTQLELVVRARGDAAALAAALRPLAQSAYPGLPYLEVQTMRDRIGPQFETWRLGATLFGAFGLLGLTLAAVGVYGALAYRVRGRTRELGIRLALGAEARALAEMVIKEGLGLTVLGVGLGTAGALAAGKALQSLLYGVSARDPVVLSASTALLLLAALIASWLPARRATRVDPVVALRSE